MEPIEKKVKLTESPKKTKNIKQGTDNISSTSLSSVINGDEIHFPGPSKQILPEDASFGSSSIFTDDRIQQSPKNNIEAPIENKVSNEFANFKVSFYIFLHTI